jgi:hypothetical protein
MVSMGRVVITDPRVLTGSNDIAVLDHNTLGGSSGSRSIHDTGQVVCLWRNWVCGVLLAQLDQVVKADDFQVGMRLGEGINVLLLGVVLCAVNNYLDILGLVHGFHEPGQQLWVGKHDLCFGLKHRVLEALLSERVVGSNNGH